MTEIPAQNDISFFGVTNFRGERKRFGIKREDRRKHVYVIGKTGMGKSTLLENMTIQDIQAGRGLAVVDPHGEYAEKMLDFIPASRMNDVIYFNPADTDVPVAFNIMERVSEDQRHLVASGLLGVFKKIWPDVWSPRMEYLLANAILALLEIPGSTLLGINRMFGEKEFRKRIVAQLSDPVIKGFWENEFAKYPEQFMREAVAAIQNKVGQFASNPLIRNIVGQVSSAVDMREMMDREKILIINLSKGKIGEENSRLLGAMLVTKLYLAAMSRVDTPEPERRDFYLYVDEFQNFATESFANILSEARKYRLNLTVAHQYIAQMEEMVQHAIFGNVGTMVVFRVGAEDAELLEKEFMPEFMIQDLVNLGFANIYVKLMIEGLTSRPFSAETLPPFPRPPESHREAIISASRERYGTPRATVEDKIRRFTTSPLGVEEEEVRGGGAPAPALPLKADRPMHETHCAECGKPVRVPFQPDGVRPVYCEEHLNLVKFRVKAAPMPSAARAETGLRPPNPPRRAVEGGGERARAPQPVSLRELKRKPEELPQSARRPEPAKSGAHLPELRRVLEEAMRRPQPSEPRPASPTPPGPARAGGPAAPDGRGSSSNANSGVLAPGEAVRFE